MTMPVTSGFSMAEVLIALAIAGLLAAMTIPQMMQMGSSQQSSKYSYQARDTGMMVVTAFERYRMSNAGPVPSTLTLKDLTPYMNFVRADTTSIVDSYNGASTDDCSTANFSCLKLHNGGMMAFQNLEALGGTATTNMTYFKFDPDGRQTDSTTNGPGKALVVFLQYNGKISDWGHLPAVGMSSWSIYSAAPSNNPSWFTGF